MKRKIVMCFLFFSILVKADNIYASSIKVLNDAGKQSTPVEAVVNRSCEAVAGSKEACLKVNSLVLIGTMTLADNSQFTKGNLEIKYKKPNKYIHKYSSNGQTMISGFDGQKFFSNISESSSQIVPVIFGELYLSNENAFFDGTDLIAGQKAYRVVSELGNAKNVMFFDIESGLKLREEYVENNKIMGIKIFSDYKLFDGYLLPTTISTAGSGMFVVQNIKRYKINSIIDDSQFQLPRNKTF